MDKYHKLLEQNKSWAASKLSADPDYFNKLVDIQKPDFLWIGCSDSRVPANEITGTLPGEIFVHRNIANLVVNTDFNMLSVLKYAVEVLKVKHIIVSGHYGCGGIKASLSSSHFGMLNKWLRHVKDVYRFHAAELDAIEIEEQRVDRLVELNIIEGVYNLAKTSIIQKAWAEGVGPALHGSVYSLKNGLLKDLIYVDSKTYLEPIYRFDFKEGLED
jgi:carbonic anhydrase